MKWLLLVAGPACALPALFKSKALVLLFIHGGNQADGKAASDLAAQFV